MSLLSIGADIEIVIPLPAFRAMQKLMERLELALPGNVIQDGFCLLRQLDAYCEEQPGTVLLWVSESREEIPVRAPEPFRGVLMDECFLDATPLMLLLAEPADRYAWRMGYDFGKGRLRRLAVGMNVAENQVVLYGISLYDAIVTVILGRSPHSGQLVLRGDNHERRLPLPPSLQKFEVV